MSIETRLEARVLATREYRERLNLPVPTPGGGWIVSFYDRSDSILLDEHLDEVRSLELQSSGAAVAMSRNGEYLAVSARSELRIHDCQGTLRHRLQHLSWDDFDNSRCVFDANHRLWCVRPGSHRGSNDCLCVLDPALGVTVAEHVIENDYGYFALWCCPDGVSALIDISCGQDGIFLYHARLNGANLDIKQLDFSDRTFSGGFAPEGQEFVTGPHHGDAIKVHAYPDAHVIASTDKERIFEHDTLLAAQEDFIDYEACYLDRNRILARTAAGRMILINRMDMSLLGSVWPEGYSLKPYTYPQGPDGTIVTALAGDLTSIHPAGHGRFLAVFGEHIMQLIEVKLTGTVS